MRPTGVVPAGPAPTISTHEITLYFVDGNGNLTKRTRVVTGELTSVTPMQLLLRGPTDAERKDGLTTEVPYSEEQVTFLNGSLLIPLDLTTLSKMALGQISCTAGKLKLPSMNGVVEGCD